MYKTENICDDFNKMALVNILHDCILCVCPGQVLGPLPNSENMTAYNVSCSSYEDTIGRCLVQYVGYCASRKYITLYCSTTALQVKGKNRYLLAHFQ